MTGPEYASGVSHMARAHARRLITAAQSAGDLGAWRLAPPKGNLQIRMHHNALSLRLLRPVGDEPPPPGPNLARIAAWHGNVLGLAGSKLLGLWSPNPYDGQVEVRIVRPTRPWELGQKSKIDIDLVLPRTADDLSQYEFKPTDEDMELVLPFEEEPEEGTSGDSTLDG
jgi:hypothetical protein